MMTKEEVKKRREELFYEINKLDVYVELIEAKETKEFYKAKVEQITSMERVSIIEKMSIVAYVDIADVEFCKQKLLQIYNHEIELLKQKMVACETSISPN